MPTIRRLTSVAIVIAGLAAAFTAVAGAKGISLVAVCGAGHCRDVTDASNGEAVGFPMGTIAHVPAATAPFVRVVAKVSGPPSSAGGPEVEIARSSYLYVPSLHLIRAQRRRNGGSGAQMRAVWQHADALLVQNLRSLLRGVPRFAPRRLDRIRHSPAVTLPVRPTLARPPADTRQWWSIVPTLAMALTRLLKRLRPGARTPGRPGLSRILGVPATALLADHAVLLELGHHAI
jgi:hypothetical protein